MLKHQMLIAKIIMYVHWPTYFLYNWAVDNWDFFEIILVSNKQKKKQRQKYLLKTYSAPLNSEFVN